MFGYDLGIDLGTTNIVIGVPGKGIRLDEPAYVAYDEEKEKVLYAGKRAYFLEGREPEGPVSYTHLTLPTILRV